MKNTLILHEDTFYDFFKPYRHPNSQHDIWGGLGLETFGVDFETVLSTAPTKVWTVLDSDNGQWIVPGIHFVNRVCYLVSEVAHEGADVQFNASPRTPFLTPLGLARQSTAVRRLLSVPQ